MGIFALFMPFDAERILSPFMLYGNSASKQEYCVRVSGCPPAAANFLSRRTRHGRCPFWGCRRISNRHAPCTLLQIRSAGALTECAIVNSYDFPRLRRRRFSMPASLQWTMTSPMDSSRSRGPLRTARRRQPRRVSRRWRPEERAFGGKRRWYAVMISG
jgi:hypothetical protein